MKTKTKTIHIFVIVVSLLLLSSNFVTPASAQTGNFVIPYDRDYYPTAVQEVVLVNLTRGDYYGLLIGANQNTSDQQWDNFTATNRILTRSFQHFIGQSLLDNLSSSISQLLLCLYAIDSDSDTSVTLLDTIRFTVIQFEEQYSPYWIAGVLLVGFAFIVFVNILLIITKFSK